jgi:membrane-associated phospholipid phosphatase
MNKILSVILILLIFFIWNGSLLSQQHLRLSTEKDSTNTGNISTDFQLAINDWGNYLSITFHPSVNHLIVAASTTAATGALFFLDEDVRDLSKRNHTEFQDRLLKIGDAYGNGIYALGLSGLLYVGGSILDQNEMKTTGRVLGEAIVIAGLTSELIKVFIGRSRPYTERGAFSFKFFEFNNDYNSLPSGHTIIAFTVSTVLAEEIDNVYASIALYSLAGLTAYQRIYSDNHWFSDTFLGAVLGYGIGHFFVKINKTSCTQSEFSIIPFIQQDNLFLSARIRL